VQARQLTALISHLNDVLTGQLLKLKADEHGIDLNRLCWLCLGSEGRDEQTIATDQDNALILASDTSDESREAIRAFAREVNLALDSCGYPLCHGGIMAGESACCLTLDEWRERFRLWIEQGSPQDLLNASIYFDFRWGQATGGNAAPRGDTGGTNHTALSQADGAQRTYSDCTAELARRGRYR
jgi:CBS domain-containing protein